MLVDSKRVKFAVVGMLIVGLLTFCGIGAFGAEEPQYGGELIYAYGVEPQSFFPGYVLGAPAEYWLYVYEPLVEMDDGGNIIPWLAKKWEFTESGKTCIMHLREGVAFTDGTPFDAQVVKFVFDTILEEQYVAINQLTGLTETEVMGQYAVAFHFEEPIAAFLANLTTMVIWNPTVYKEKGPDYMGTHMIGTGPFIVDEWQHGQYVRFVKNPDYWQEGLPYLDAITIKTVPETSVRTMMIQAGEVDRTVALNDYDLPKLGANPNIKVVVTPSTRQYYAILNNLKHPLDNPIVRRALNFAIDKKAIVDTIFAGTGASLPKAPILSDNVVGFTDMTRDGAETLYPYNPEKARLLLETAGFLDRDNDGILENPRGNDLELALWGPKGRYKGDADVAELLQTMLRDVGIKVVLKFHEYATYKTLLAGGPDETEHEIALLSWGILSADADDPMMNMFYTKSWKPVSSNRMYYSNLEGDELILAAHYEVNPEKRREIIKEWAEIVIEDAPIIFLPTLNLNLVKRTYVHGDKILSVEHYPARFAWLDHEEMRRQGVNR